MDKTIKELARLFRTMVADRDRGELWRNIPLGRQAFALMLSLPDVVPGEIESSAEKARLLANMLEQMHETDTPRFCISVREEIARLDPDDSDNRHSLDMLREYIDPSVSAEEWGSRHHRSLRFDPVERTPEWEECIYEVEREVARQLKGEPRRMGFCFEYWSAKAAALQRYGITWRSPRTMNPRVIFD